MFALIDCNNYFVSCERIFRPDLSNKPVVVLSSNDGCAVARSSEAKALGIPMGAPAFKYRQLFQDHGVVQFSANFELYGDISKRITTILTEITPRIEIYSIDESFLDLSQLLIEDYRAWGKAIRQRLWHEIGIPVSIGIAPTKTLAKLASERAKKDAALQGVLVLSELNPPKNTYYLQQTPLEEIWGIGRRLAPFLRSHGLATAHDMAHMRPQLARQLMGKHGNQIVLELSGQSCLPLQLDSVEAKSISRTRTFGQDTSIPQVIEAAISSFAAQATFKLRQSGQLTRRAALFLTTSRHKPGYKVWRCEATFEVPTANTSFIISRLLDELHTILEPSYHYHRAGVLLYDFVTASSLQTDLLGIVDISAHERAQRRMRTLDRINKRYGKHSLYFAVEGLGNSWEPQRRLRSPRYTSAWSDVPSATIL